MAFSHAPDSYTYEGITLHGVLKPKPHHARKTNSEFYGVQGVSHIVDDLHHQVYEAKDCWLRGYATQAALATAISNLRVQTAVPLKGTLTVTGTAAGTYTKMTFTGFYIDEIMQYDPLSTNWIARIVLQWEQRL